MKHYKSSDIGKKHRKHSNEPLSSARKLKKMSTRASAQPLYKMYKYTKGKEGMRGKILSSKQLKEQYRSLKRQKRHATGKKLKLINQAMADVGLELVEVFGVDPRVL